MEWYQSNPQLQEIEIKTMNELYPDAKCGYLPNGRMYWTIIIHPVIFGVEKEWTLLVVYDSDHPQNKWNGSVKIYPVRPNHYEMEQLVNNSSVSPKNIPYLLLDDDNNIYIHCCSLSNNEDINHEGVLISSAATQIRFAIRWITIFEVGLIEQKVWFAFLRTTYNPKTGAGFNKYDYICTHFSDIPEIKQLS